MSLCRGRAACAARGNPQKPVQDQQSNRRAQLRAGRGGAERAGARAALRAERLERLAGRLAEVRSTPPSVGGSAVRWHLSKEEHQRARAPARGEICTWAARAPARASRATGSACTCGARWPRACSRSCARAGWGLAAAQAAGAAPRRAWAVSEQRAASSAGDGAGEAGGAVIAPARRVCEASARCAARCSATLCRASSPSLACRKRAPVGESERGGSETVTFFFRGGRR